MGRDRGLKPILERNRGIVVKTEPPKRRGRPPGSKNKPKIPSIPIITSIPKIEDEIKRQGSFRIAREWAIKPSPADIQEWLSLVEARDHCRRRSEIVTKKLIAGSKSYWMSIWGFEYV